MRKRKTLFLDILTADAALRRRMEKRVYRNTTYAEWIRRILDLEQDDFAAVDASKEILPDPASYRAMIIGGSAEDPVEGREKRWMERAYALIRRAAEKRVPIFGICGGMQFTVRALGGKVIDNPKGRHFGASALALTPLGRRDKLFSGLGKKILVQCNHRCIVGTIKPGWNVLASSRTTPIEALAIGERIRLVEFHPERDSEGSRAIALLGKKSLVKEGLFKEEDFPGFLASLKSSSRVGKNMLKNFMAHFAY